MAYPVILLSWPLIRRSPSSDRPVLVRAVISAGIIEKDDPMARRANDSKNWGGLREPKGGREPMFDEPTDVLRITLPKRLIRKLRNKAKASGTSSGKLLVKILERMAE